MEQVRQIFESGHYVQTEMEVRVKKFARQVCVCTATQTLHYAQNAVQK